LFQEPFLHESQCIALVLGWACKPNLANHSHAGFKCLMWQLSELWLLMQTRSIETPEHLHLMFLSLWLSLPS
jgi:hypothetical protein